jgi:peptidoglycan/LPS O-acetylase OafA/YrhL
MAFAYSRTWRRDRYVFVIIAVMIVFSLVFRVVILCVFNGNPLAGNVNNVWSRNLPDFLDIFGLGIGLAYLRESFPNIKIGNRLTICCVLVAAISFLIAMAATHSRSGWVVVNPLGGLTAISCISPSVLNSNILVMISSILNSRVTRYLGYISYGLFLWHMAVIDLLVKLHLWKISHSGPYAFVEDYVAVIVVAGCVSSLSYHLIEKPCCQWKKAWVFQADSLQTVKAAILRDRMA